MGATEVKAMLDSEADQSVVCPNLVNRFEETGAWLTGRLLTNKVRLDGFQEGLRVVTSRGVKLGLQFATAAGKLMLRNVVCWVAAEPLLIWLDDLLGYAKTPMKLLAMLERVLVVCEDKGLKLNPRKCKFYLVEAEWCGRFISKEGVRHDPARIDALKTLPKPISGKDLQ